MKDLIDNLIQKSLEDLYAKDKYLIERGCAERSITFQFAHHLMNNIQDTPIAEYNVDCEFNRDEYLSKHIIMMNHEYKIYPDVIVHKRGTCENLMVIEFKTWWNSDISSDIVKLKNMITQLGYKYAYSIVLNKLQYNIQSIEI